MTAATVITFGNVGFILTVFEFMVARKVRADMIDMLASVLTVVVLLAF